MNVLLGLALITAIMLFALSALHRENEGPSREALELLQRQRDEYNERDLGDRYWLAKKQLELMSTEEMTRIADMANRDPRWFR